jgi:hypothetical protein
LQAKCEPSSVRFARHKARRPEADPTSTVRVRQMSLQSLRGSGRANHATISISAVVAGGSGGATYVAA